MACRSSKSPLRLYRVNLRDQSLSNIEFYPDGPERIAEFLKKGRVFQVSNATIK